MEKSTHAEHSTLQAQSVSDRIEDALTADDYCVYDGTASAVGHPRLTQEDIIIGINNLNRLPLTSAQIKHIQIVSHKNTLPGIDIEFADAKHISDNEGENDILIIIKAPNNH